ncbi:hypothetical protein BKA57DRAFT_27561 [Linnemannia elongata]|nr:hypothetical protein BKA57DRAFT_27561 [Linnemannia elongata]
MCRLLVLVVVGSRALTGRGAFGTLLLFPPLGEGHVFRIRRHSAWFVLVCVCFVCCTVVV